MSAAGITTFTSVIGSSACSKCGAWQGKIVTDGGPVGDIMVPHAITAEPTPWRVDGTLAEMRASGWGHPNCRCTLVPGLPGGPDPTQYSTHDPQAQADREKLRELEREVRAAKRDEDPDAIGEAQAALRAHIDETGIIRREYREQLPFADGGDTSPRGRTKPTLPSVPREQQTWEQRQRRLGIQRGPVWDQQPHEIVFYERFTDAGHTVRVIPKSAVGKPTNDFRWLDRDGIEIEVKRPKRAEYGSSARLIRDAVQSARENHQFTKDRFFIDLDGRELGEKLRNQLSRYNQRNPGNTIASLWVFARSGLVEIELL